MKNSLEELKSMLPIPANPVENIVDWENVEQKLGTKLPEDYKQFINTYGSGSLGEFMMLLNPTSQNKYLNTFKKMEAMSDFDHKQREFSNIDDTYPIPLYPNSGGILIWGITDNGEELYWLTTGEPDNWKIIYNSTRDGEFETYDESVTSFLTKVVKGTIKSKFFPEDWIAQSKLFIPLDIS